MVEERQYSLADIEKILKKRMKTIEGSDTDNKDYTGITALWKYIFPEFRKSANKKAKISHDGSSNCGEWYSKANEYWESEENCPITDGKIISYDSNITLIIINSFLIRWRSWWIWCIDRNGCS